ncbi:glycine cleavage system protein R [Shewanella sp. NIFS-20-20]|uniref:glycine cleavage system protein R n=1 Tax=Shewanella sp. NIFS-20-20 TaxID=2853806 RepID=UPI001C48B82D|nr:ACT domain-containing protein [Shewanella sp. NIFS-20-20]MBV7316531.1 amino acid-binding protein [Shewanella sp. NIFS-20-20]
MARYLLTLQVPDRTGLVEIIANDISRHGGTWLDSELMHLDGTFAAIIQISAPESAIDALIENIECIDGLTLHYRLLGQPSRSQRINWEVVAYDRVGLVRDIANKISALNINIEHLSSQLDQAEHTGVPLFRASLSLSDVTDAKASALKDSLYQLGDDVVIDKID